MILWLNCLPFNRKTSSSNKKRIGYLLHFLNMLDLIYFNSPDSLVRYMYYSHKPRVCHGQKV